MTISAPSNPALILDDGASTFAPTGGGTFTRKGMVDGDPRVYDSGTDLVPSSFVAAYQASVLDTASGDEQYVLTIEGCASADFTGEVRGLDEWSMSVKDQQDIRGVTTLDPLDNTIWRYLRLSIQVSGTTPEIAVFAFLRPLSDMTAYEFHELVQLQVFAMENIQNAIGCWIPWANGVAGGGPYNDGRYPIYDGFGHSTLLACPAQWADDYKVDVPQSYGAIGDGLSHPASGVFDTLTDCQAVYPFATSLAMEMDYLGWQKAINTGRKIGSPPAVYIMCNADPASQKELTYVSGIAWVEATAARWKFNALAPKTTTEHLYENYDFATDEGWVNASIWGPGELIDTTFDTGAAVMTDIGEPGTQATFYQWGRLLSDIPVGRYTVTWEAEATLGDSYGLGNFNPPYMVIGFFATSPGEGPNLVGRDSGTIYFNVSPPTGGVIDARSGSFDINVPVSGSVWLTVSAGGYGNFRVTKLDIQPALLNCAVLMTRDGAPEHYPIMQPLAGIWIEGPAVANGVTGVLWKSFSNTDGNVAALEKCNITGFEFGAETSDGAYLTEIISCNIFSNRIGYRHRPGAENAGENMRFVGGGIFNNVIAIDNTGRAEINIVTMAIDYNGQAIVNNAGTINMSLLRLEQWCDASTPGPIIHCLPGGKVTGSQMRFLGAGTPGTMTEPPVKLDSALSSCTFHMCDIYNLSSATGYAASGPGRLRITDMQNNGNPNIGPYLLSATPAMDVLGGAGFFEPMTTYVPVAPDGIHLEGGLFPTGSHTSIDRWNTNITTISVTTDFAWQGTRCLKITKADSDDPSINDSLHILIPTTGGNLLGGFKILMPHDQPSTGTIYFRVFWVRVIGQDDLGRPRYGPSWSFKGETDIPVPLEGSDTWIGRSFGTFYENDSQDPATQAGIRPPVWATHLLLLLDHMSIPPMTYYIDAIHANEAG